jgi:protein SCO1/2
MFRPNPNTAVLVIGVAASVILLFAASAFSQKTEHYNSPLYSPRYYDPNTSTTNGLPDALQKVGIEQRLGENLPLDVEFTNEQGQPVKLGEYFKSGRPVILALVYYECPMLCNEVLNGLTGSLKGMSLTAGKDFDVLAISFDARENDKPDLARNKKASYLEHYGRPGTDNGWHFLTGKQESIDAVTKAVGFKYYWDENSKQFAHVGGIMITTPEGKLSRYFYGIDYAPKDVKFGIIESSADRIGNPAEQLLLYCYHYDPATGKYGLAILRVLRVVSVAMLLGLGSMLFVFWRKGKRKEIE